MKKGDRNEGEKSKRAIAATACEMKRGADTTRVGNSRRGTGPVIERYRLFDENYANTRATSIAHTPFSLSLGNSIYIGRSWRIIDPEKLGNSG